VNLNGKLVRFFSATKCCSPVKEFQMIYKNFRNCPQKMLSQSILNFITAHCNAVLCADEAEFVYISQYAFYISKFVMTALWLNSRCNGRQDLITN